mmetsp:Transcript_42211/g.123593  ORF Transcript_42211/g.123593 Transcript_42211/m.123593 type:complete len:118 (-) Transcript_42211:35-388(-)
MNASPAFGHSLETEMLAGQELQICHVCLRSHQTIDGSERCYQLPAMARARMRARALRIGPPCREPCEDRESHTHYNREPGVSNCMNAWEVSDLRVWAQLCDVHCPWCVVDKGFAIVV